jgi:hypothetical protein
VLRIVDELAPEATVLMCYCRDEVDGLLYLLNSGSYCPRSNSIVVMGGKQRRWFPTQAQRIAGKLEEKGHHVVFVQPGGRNA